MEKFGLFNILKTSFSASEPPFVPPAENDSFAAQAKNRQTNDEPQGIKGARQNLPQDNPFPSSSDKREENYEDKARRENAYKNFIQRQEDFSKRIGGKK